ncbi:copper amine oxidase N-terminal domain-containing protein [Paenibacillus sp. MWE-103]|uniref:Copper amine oxidase N-terminal domain-containing protein n=1 Tax=Paenibacillus artemisiicola TaxID=1172618 RepID=A0ABS3WA24_9BACL|nr:copper amine oxidase N-terminal domain-containing protein [Paenibacillus artemisiicola]MBO7745186.1 copper amine oxidase N-terminal domain-containing protein [Paenibacillus artemisiicola]
MKSWILRKKALGLLLLSLVVLVVAGCQAVGGVDLNAMLKQAVKVTAYEGNESVEFKLLMKDGAADMLAGEEAELLKLVSDVKLTLTDVKTSEKDGMSATGNLALGAKNIGFALKMNDEVAELDLEGAKQPILLPLSEGGPAVPAGASDADAATLTEAGKAVIDAVSGYAIDNLPNPSHLSVTPGQETVNGESVTGMSVHADLTGKELWNWLKSYLDALIADKEGLKAMLKGLLEAVQSQEGAIAASPAEELFGSLPEEDNLDEAADQIYEALTQLKAELAKAETEEADALNSVFNDGTYVKGDVFIDGKLDIRKAVLEAGVKLTDSAAAENEEEDMGMDAMMPFEGIQLKIASDRWNVNGDVKPLQPSTGKPALNANALMSMQGYEVLRQFEPNSVVYDLLRNQAHISRQTVIMSADYSSSAPIITPSGITIVPLRYTAQSFGATLAKSGGSLIVKDGATNATIGLKNGSGNAIINGKTVKWSFPTTVVNGVTYVPARDFAKAFGAEIRWENMFGTKVLIMNREP